MMFNDEIMEGIEGKRAGMKAAEEHANPEWKAEAARAVRQAARELAFFTTDDVFARMSPDVSTHEHRAMGPIMKNAARDGVCITTSRTRECTRRQRHAAPLRVWESLEFS